MTTNARRLSGAQKKALVALQLLYQRYPDCFHSRLTIRYCATGMWSGYPLKTLWILYKEGLAEPQCAQVLKAVRTKICTCGSDRWRITRPGSELALSYRVHLAQSPEHLDFMVERSGP